jgi:hypothetical protein
MQENTSPIAQNAIKDESKTVDLIDTLTTWDTPVNCRHNVRVLCDLSGLSWYAKSVITACVEQESGFNNGAVNHNINSEGLITSSDWGIVQINDRYHIGPNLEFVSVQFVLDHPQTCVQWMIDMYKAGKLSMWSSYSSGAYKRFMP